MASLNLNEQLFFRTFARELGITEIALEAAISEALLRAQRKKVSFVNQPGGLDVKLGNIDMIDPPRVIDLDFFNAKARLGRG